MPVRRRFLQAFAGVGVTTLAGCSFGGGEYHDFEADNRRDDAETVTVAWNDTEAQFSLASGESVSRRDLLPDEDHAVVVTVGETRETVDWSGGGTLHVEIEPDSIHVGTYYDD